MSCSAFLKARRAYEPRIPQSLANLTKLCFETRDKPQLDVAAGDIAKLQEIFRASWGQNIISFGAEGSQTIANRPITAAVVLSGGPAPGGHNVIWGLVQGLAELSPQSRVLGFKGGPSGILNNQFEVLTPDAVAPYRNTGGFDMIGSGRTKIETLAQLERCREVLEQQGVECLIVIGGDDSNTNAALLAEYFLRKESSLRVIGVPKTIDGDLMNAYVETSFGFDTAVRIYSELVSNISRDALSAKKYYHFIRLMGRSASHITLETAFQTQPNLALISEEVAAKQQTLRDLVEELGTLIKERTIAGKNYGIVLIPEGIIEFIPEMRALIKELNSLLADHKDYIGSLSGFTAQSEYIHRKLSADTSHTLSSLPIDIQRQLLMDRDPHGNVIVSAIETEKLLIEMLTDHLKEEKAAGRYQGTFATQRHFLGYEGRCGCPSNFDADYGYSLGRNAAALAGAGVTGYMSVIGGLTKPPSEWQASGVPLSSMMTLEIRHGKPKPVIKKALVELSSKAFTVFSHLRTDWRTTDHYRFAGPIQYFGPETLCDRVPRMLHLQHQASDNISW